MEKPSLGTQPVHATRRGGRALRKREVDAVASSATRQATPVIDEAEPSSVRHRYIAGKAEAGPGLSRRPRHGQKLSDELARDGLDGLDTYGITEFRDGLFDALYTTQAVDEAELLRRLETAPPTAPRTEHTQCPKSFVLKQWHDAKGVVRRVTTTRSGIRLLKSFLAYFVAYVICLVPATRNWLGPPTCYLAAVSVIVNHPGRSLGAQLDGAILALLGAALGLGFGALCLWLSTSTLDAQVGYGGILAIFLSLFMAVTASVRSYYIRLYQLVLSAGIAVTYTCLTNVTGQHVAWSKLRNLGVPWALGQAISLLVCAIVLPDAGARALAESLHDVFKTSLNGLAIPRSVGTRRCLAQSIVGLSQMYRDLAIDLSATRFDPRDVKVLRNLLQGVLRSLLPLDSDTPLFEAYEESQRLHNPVSPVPSPDSGNRSSPPDLHASHSPIPLDSPDPEDQAIRLVCFHLKEPTERLLHAARAALQSCDAVVMNMSGFRQALGPPEDVSSDLLTPLIGMRQMMIRFDVAETALVEGGGLSAAASSLPEVVKILTFSRQIRLVGGAVENVMTKVNQMQQRAASRFPSVYPPSYAFWKALNRNNAQVRHDRGGVTAGSYFRNFEEISSMIQEIKSRSHVPFPIDLDIAEDVALDNRDPDDAAASEERKFRYRLWRALRRFQGFEARFALKTTMVTSLLSVPAWLPQSRYWWNQYEIWWTVVMAWFMMHPRVGGNFQDLLARSTTAALGALWSGLAFAAGNGNPFVMAAFAVVYMLPMMYRFSQSAHARSGVVGCLSFTVISLGLVAADDPERLVVTVVVRGASFVIGVVAAILINWLLWPFVARHELQKAVASMMFFLSILYRSVVGKYVYYEEGDEPSSEDIERSEILEGRMREGFARIRQLTALTGHEIRLRAPFNPRPYVALVDSCEGFFENIVAVRNSSLFWHPRFLRDGNDEAVERLLSYRRDAVAAILSTLYILAGALKSGRKVPKYLPSAPAARKRLIDKMAELEGEFAIDHETVIHGRWWQVYSYSFNESLTGCAAQLDLMEPYTKLIVGEQGVGINDDDSESDSGDNNTLI